MFLILLNIVVLNVYAAAVRPTIDFATLVDFTAKEMGIETNPSKPLPKLTFESEITLKEFQKEVLPQWGFNPEQISNVYVLSSNRIIVIDDSDYYRRLHREIDDSIVHELVHYFQVQYRGYTLGDLDDNAEMDAVYYQTLFRERYFPQLAIEDF